MVQCSICKRSFLNERGLVQHTEQVHGRSGVYKGVRAWESSRQQTGAITIGVKDEVHAYDSEQLQYCAIRQRWSCDICDRCFPKQLQLEQHLKSETHEEHRYACAGCRKSFPSLGSLYQHLASTDHSSKESRLIHVLVKDAEYTRLLITNFAAPAMFFEATLHFDGSARPNPGAGGCGVYLLDDRGNVLYEGGSAVRCLPGEYNVTSMQAEYAGLLLGLHRAIAEGVKRLKVRGDCLSMIKQMQGLCACKSKRLRQYYAGAKSLEGNFQLIQYEHISRVHNSVAHQLAYTHAKIVL